MWCCHFTEEKSEVQESPSLRHPAIHQGKIWDFFLDSMGASRKQTPSQAHSRTSRGCTGSNLINSCKWFSGVGGWLLLEGSTLDFLHLPLISFHIFDFLTLYSHLLWQLVLPDSVVICQGIRQYYSPRLMSKLSPGEAVIHFESPFPFSAIWSVFSPSVVVSNE